ncbi:hypothetical protein M1271_05690 [Patescibacteria group bacterium]|nr:hypothetical protein [Patescibacteria group bacterium]
MVKKYIRRSDVRKIKAWMQYQKNKRFLIKLDGAWFQYSGEDIPTLPPKFELLKRIHIIRKKALKEKKRLNEQIYRQMYGENYREGQLAEKRLSRILNKKNIVPELFNIEVDKLVKELNEYTNSRTSNLLSPH